MNNLMKIAKHRAKKVDFVSSLVSGGSDRHLSSRGLFESEEFSASEELMPLGETSDGGGIPPDRL